LTIEAALSSALEGAIVVEAGDERGEFAGMLLAMLGAEVIKLEGRQGSNSRRIGPFATGDRTLEQSLCFARYNLGKKSVSLELDHPAAGAVRDRLGRYADIIIDSGEAAAVKRRRPFFFQITSKFRADRTRPQRQGRAGKFPRTESGDQVAWPELSRPGQSTEERKRWRGQLSTLQGSNQNKNPTHHGVAAARAKVRRNQMNSR